MVWYGIDKLQSQSILSLFFSASFALHCAIISAGEPRNDASLRERLQSSQQVNRETMLRFANDCGCLPHHACIERRHMEDSIETQAI